MLLSICYALIVLIVPCRSDPDDHYISNEFLDNNYQTFFNAISQSGQSTITLVLSTLDGYLHSFTVSFDSSTDNQSIKLESRWKLKIANDEFLYEANMKSSFNYQNKQITLLPSLQGALFTLQGSNIQAMPFTSDHLIDSHFKFNENSTVIGSKSSEIVKVNIDNGTLLHRFDWASSNFNNHHHQSNKSHRASDNNNVCDDDDKPPLESECNDDSSTKPSPPRGTTVIFKLIKRKVMAVNLKTCKEKWFFKTTHLTCELNDNGCSSKFAHQSLHLNKLFKQLLISVNEGKICFNDSNNQFKCLYLNSTLVKAWTMIIDSNTNQPPCIEEVDLLRMSTPTNDQNNQHPILYLTKIQNNDTIYQSFMLASDRDVDKMVNKAKLKIENDNILSVEDQQINAPNNMFFSKLYSSHHMLITNDMKIFLILLNDPQIKILNSKHVILVPACCAIDVFVDKTFERINSRRSLIEHSVSLLDNIINYGIYITIALASILSSLATTVSTRSTEFLCHAPNPIVICKVIYDLIDYSIFNLIWWYLNTFTKVYKRKLPNKLLLSKDDISKSYFYEVKRWFYVKSITKLLTGFMPRYEEEYRHVRCLGRGGYGIVFEAVNRLDYRHVAIKRIDFDEKASKHILQEIRVLAQLQHKHVVAYNCGWFEVPPCSWQESRDVILTFDLKKNNESGTSTLKNEQNTNYFLSKTCEITNYSITSQKESRTEEERSTNVYMIQQSNYFDNSTKYMDDNGKSSNRLSNIDDSMEIVFEKDKSSNQLSNIDDSMEIVFEKDKSSNQLSNIDDSMEIVFEKDKSSNRLSNIDDSMEIVFEKDKSSNQLSNIGDSMEIVFEKDKSSNRLSNIDDSMEIVFDKDEEWSDEFSTSDKEIESDNEKSFSDQNSDKDSDMSESSTFLRNFNKNESQFSNEHENSSIDKFVETDNQSLNDKTSIVSNYRSKPSKHFLELSLKFGETLLPINADSLKKSSYTDLRQEQASNDDNRSLRIDQHGEGLFRLGNNSDGSKESRPGFLYFCMELCRPDTLREWLLKNPTTSQRDFNDAFWYFHQICLGVRYIHRHNLLHRDLKPSNILFSRDENHIVKIGDFGLTVYLRSKKTKTDDQDNDQSDDQDEKENMPESFQETANNNGVAGTELYISPEQYERAPLSQSIDMYSLGIIFFELMYPMSTGFERVNTLNCVRDLCEGTLSNLNQKYTNREFDSVLKYAQTHSDEWIIVRWLMASKPDDRPTVADLLYCPVFTQLAEKYLDYRRFSSCGYQRFRRCSFSQTDSSY